MPGNQIPRHVFFSTRCGCVFQVLEEQAPTLWEL